MQCKLLFMDEKRYSKKLLLVLGEDKMICDKNVRLFLDYKYQTPSLPIYIIKVKNHPTQPRFQDFLWGENSWHNI